MALLTLAFHPTAEPGSPRAGWLAYAAASGLRQELALGSWQNADIPRPRRMCGCRPAGHGRVRPRADFRAVGFSAGSYAASEAMRR